MAESDPPNTPPTVTSSDAAHLTADAGLNSGMSSHTGSSLAGASVAGQELTDLKVDSPPKAPEREAFGRDELAIVLSRYDVGPINSLEDFPHGSRRSPKVRIKAVQGDYLLKRRRRVAPEMAELEYRRTAFTHEIQLLLQSKGYPVAKLVGTKESNRSMARIGTDIYELFEFVTGESWEYQEGQAMTSGRRLSQLHYILRNFDATGRAASGSYHRSAKVEQAFAKAEKVVPTLFHDCNRDLLAANLAYLRNVYRKAGDLVEECGFARWPQQLIHADWHPGNLVYLKDAECRAVLDFDTVRLGQRALDLAGGAYQFSCRKDGPAHQWPEMLDQGRYRAFFAGYDSVKGNEGSVAEIKAVPWLMIENIIAEALMAIAGKGRQVGVRGDVMIEVLRRRAEWINARAQMLTDLLL